MYSLAIAKFDIPGEAGFPLNAVYAKPSSPSEAGNLYSEIYQVLIYILFYSKFTALF